MKPYLLALLLCAPALASAFDFTPRVMETPFLNGGTHEARYFQNKGKFYRIHVGDPITLNGSGGKATFTFNHLEQAELRLETSPHQPEDSFSSETIEKLVKAAANYAPASATTIEQKHDLNTKFAQLGWKAYSVNTTYQIPAGTIEQQVIFINFAPDDQIVAVITAYPQHSEKATALALDILYALQEVPEESLKGPIAF